jgi:hypothetical protein
MFKSEDSHQARAEHARTGEEQGGELEPEGARERARAQTRFTAQGAIPPVSTEGPSERLSASDLAEQRGGLGGNWGGLLGSVGEMLGGAVDRAPEVKAANGIFSGLFGGRDKKGEPPTIQSSTLFKAAAAPSSRTTIGAGESVDLSSSAKGAWSASGGTLLGGINGTEAYWKAPARAGTYTITLDADGQIATKTFEVVEPEKIHYRFKKQTYIDPGRAGAGMQLTMDLSPSHVSFAALEIKEMPHEASAQDGYFLRPGYPAFDARHRPNPSWTGVLANNLLAATDKADMEVERLPRSEGGAWMKGKVVWKIPHNFKGRDDKADKHFTDVVQTMEILDKEGTCRVTKGSDGATVTRKPDDFLEGEE